MDPERTSPLRLAMIHAVAWLVSGNLIGLWLAILLLKPEWNLGEFSYGRIAPVHLNIQLYGWTAMPLVAWLFSIYEVHRSKARIWAMAAVWAWSFALVLGVCAWLSGQGSGKIFLDWKSGSLWAYVVALSLLWIVLVAAWFERSGAWGVMKRRITGACVIGLAFVPVTMCIAASPKVYPPIDRSTGGPTGASLLGSTLIVIGLMLVLPRLSGVRKREGKDLWKWIFYGVSLLVAGVTEKIGGTHSDITQILAMLFLVPWAWILPRDWAGFDWPEGTAAWRVAAMFWWAVLVLSGVTMYFPRLLDHLKFTQGLVGHSHLAMAGFTTSFVALLMSVLNGRGFGNVLTVGLWNASVLGMITVLFWMGWKEGAGYGWMIETPSWREAGFMVRAAFGLVMLVVSLLWLKDWSLERRRA